MQFLLKKSKIWFFSEATLGWTPWYTKMVYIAPDGQVLSLINQRSQDSWLRSTNDASTLRCKFQMVNFGCFFPHHWGPFQVLQAKPWGIHTLTDFFWSIVTFFQLFFRRYCFCLINKWKIAGSKLLMFCLCLVQIGFISALLTRPALARVRGGHLRSTGTLGAEDRHPTGAQEGGELEIVSWLYLLLS